MCIVTQFRISLLRFVVSSTASDFNILQYYISIHFLFLSTRHLCLCFIVNSDMPNSSVCRRVGKTAFPEGEIAEMTLQMQLNMEERRTELMKVRISISV